MAFDTPRPDATPPRIEEALAFDDVLLVPGYSQVLPSATDTRTRVTRIIGRPEVEAVDGEDLNTGARRLVECECDTVILTGDWIPANHLARRAGVPLDPAARAPWSTPPCGPTSPGVFAIGNALHPGRHRGHRRAGRRHGRPARARPPRRSNPSQDHVRLHAEAPFRWITTSAG